MKRLYLLYMVAVNLITMRADERKTDMGIGDSKESFVPSSLTLTPHQYPMAENVVNRITEQAGSRIVYRLIFDTHFSFADRSPQDIASKRGTSAVGDGLTYALREYMLDTALYDWVDDQLLRVGGSFSGFLRDILSGDEWRKHNPSPSDIEFIERRDDFVGFQKGIRPLSDSPYAFLSYGWRDGKHSLRMENSLRLTLESWREPAVGFYTEIPIRSWRLGLGVEKRAGGNRIKEWERHGELFTSTNRSLSATIGLRGKLLSGFSYLGADILGKQMFALWSFQY